MMKMKFQKNLMFMMVCLVLLSMHQQFAGPLCDDYQGHLRYWNVTELGPGDLVGLAKRTACDVEDPCGQLVKHIDYWAAKGYDGDPVRRGLLYAACETQKAMAPGVRFLNDLLQGKMPSELKGSVSQHVLKGAELIGDIAKQLDTITVQLRAAYKQLAEPKAQLAQALEQLEAGKGQVQELMKDIKAQALIPANIKTPALSGMNKMLETLPKIELVLKGMYDTIHKRVPTTMEPKLIQQQAYNQHVDSIVSQQLAPIQQHIDTSKKILAQKNHMGLNLADQIQAYGKELENRNL